MLLQKFLHRLVSFICIFLFFAGYSLAQKQVAGIVKDAKGTAIAQVTVSLKNSRGYILRFNQSNAQGRYVLSLPDTPAMQHLHITINVLGYKKIEQQLQAEKLTYNFILEEQPIDLKEVEVKKKPQIISIGDTLSYDVASFARPEDRSIGDVIRRLPGISVADNGQISYNGKTISNLFIHGDDLMDGRYGLATKVISKDMIKSVDVMQNHQPVKVLQNKVFTEDVAMNLVLKDEKSIKLGGQAMLGGGLPKQYDVALNGMMFNKTFKMLNSIQANNSGVDYKNDFEQLGTALGVGNSGNPVPKSLLSASTVSNPDVPKVNYYFNKSGVINANNLYNFKNNLQLKANVQLFMDKNTMDYYGNTANYLPNDTIIYSEWQRNWNKPNRLNIALTAMQNKQQYFLNNKLSLNLAGNDAYSYLDFNGNTFGQNLNASTRQFSNDFSYTPALKNKDVLDFRWYISYFENPQTLQLDSGLNADVLNNGVPYAGLVQEAKIPSWLSNATLSYRVLNAGAIKHNYQLGMVNERQELNAKLSLLQLDGASNAYSADAGNELHWKRDKYFINGQYYLKKQMWDVGLILPLSLQSINYWQSEYQLDEEKTQFLFNPSVNARLYFNAEDYLRLGYDYQNLIGDITSIYRGSILANFRSLTANQADLQQRNVHASSLYYNFQRSIIMLFINASISHKKTEANSVLSTTIDNQVQQTVLLPYKNNQDALSANVGISKYIFALATTLKAGGSWNKTRYNQFLNQERLPFNNYSKTLSLGIESKPVSTITLSYNGLSIWNSSEAVNRADNNLANKTWRIQQGLNLGHSPIPNLNLNLEGKSTISAQPNNKNLNYFFMNAKVRYKLANWRTDLVFDAVNILNVKKYEVYYLSSNQFAISSYQLRGRMAILRATFIL